MSLIKSNRTRWLVSCLLVGAVLQSGMLGWDTYRASHLRIPSVGDTVPNVSLRSLTAAKRVRLSEIGTGCKLMIFYDTQCRGCSRAADEWAGVKVANTAATQIPVIWVGSSDDTEAREWSARYILNSYVVSASAFRSLGIQYYPQFYIVDADNVLAAKGGGYRSIVESLAEIETCAKSKQADVVMIRSN